MITQLTAQVTDKTEEVESLRADRKLQREEYAAQRKAQKEEHEVAIARIEHQRREAALEATSLRETVHKLSRDNASLVNERKILQSNSDKLDAKISSLEAKLDAQHQAREEEASEHARVLATLETKLENVTSSLERSKNTAESAQTSNEALIARVRRISTILDSLEGQIPKGDVVEDGFREMKMAIAEMAGS